MNVKGVPAARTECGFQFGPALAECWASDIKRGWVLLGITTNKHRLNVYVTKTGRIRVHKDGKELA